MKIACTATSRVPSTAANSIQMMKACDALAQLGHEVCLWVPGDVRSAWEKLKAFYGLTTEFEVRGVPSIRLLRRYDFALLTHMQLRQWKADLVYTWLIQSGIHALNAGIPAILEMHDRPMGQFGPGLFSKFAAHDGKKRTLVITHALQKALETEFAIVFQPGEVTITPNGVDLQAYMDLPNPVQARKALGIPERPTALFSGHLYAGRGADLMARMAQQLPEVQFVWVGGRTEDVAAWKEKLSAQGLANVILTGFIENQHLPRAIAAGDVLLMPYERQIAGSSGGNSADICSPMKMFEYLAAGRAIVSSELPVIHEVLNAQTAVFCEPDDTRSWCDAVQKLLQNDALRTRMGAAAHRMSVEYSWKNRARKALAGFMG